MISRRHALAMLGFSASAGLLSQAFADAQEQEPAGEKGKDDTPQPEQEPVNYRARAVCVDGYRPGGHIQQIRFSRDGSTLLIASESGICELFSGSSLQRLNTLSFPGKTDFVLTPDGKILYCAVDNRISLWNVRTGAKIADIPGMLASTDIEGTSTEGIFDRKGEQVALLAPRERNIAARKAFIANARTGAIQCRFTVEDGHGTVHVAFGASGKKLFTGTDSGYRAIWDTVSGQCIKDLGNINIGRAANSGGGNVCAAASSPDGKISAVAGIAYIHEQKSRSAPYIEAFDAETGKQLFVLTSHPGGGGIDVVSFSPRGDTFATGCCSGTDLVSGPFNGAAQVWETATGKPLATLQTPLYGATLLRYSPDGKFVTTWSKSVYDNTIVVCEAKTGARVCTLADTEIYCADVAPNGKDVVTYHWHENAVKFWKLAA